MLVGPVAISTQQSKICNSIGVLAQLVERLNGIEEVRGSNPLGSIDFTRFEPLGSGVFVIQE